MRDEVWKEDFLARLRHWAHAFGRDFPVERSLGFFYTTNVEDDPNGANEYMLSEYGTYRDLLFFNESSWDHESC